jgi:hypothetical protein
MTPECYRHLRQVFHAECELQPDEQAHELRRLCADDEATVATLTRLLNLERLAESLAVSGRFSSGALFRANLLNYRSANRDSLQILN